MSTVVETLRGLDELPVRDIPPLRHLYPNLSFPTPVALCGHRRGPFDPPARFPADFRDRHCATCLHIWEERRP